MAISRLTTIAAVALLAVFGLIVIHAPLTVWLGTLFPSVELLIKSWKEIVLVLLVIPLGIAAWRVPLRKRLPRNLFLAIGLFATIHVLLSPLTHEMEPLVAGLMIDLRFLLFFVLVYVVVVAEPKYRRLFIQVGLGMALFSLIFATLQVFVLPRDILAAVGYGKTTITPFLTVDNNPAFVRVNGTFRGPNPLGAYAGMVMAIVMAYVARYFKRISLGAKLGGGVLSLLAMVAVGASYSRSALVAAGVGVGIVGLVILGRYVSLRNGLVGMVVLGVISAASVYAFRDTLIVQQVILHDDPATHSQVNSNEQHVDSLQQGVALLLTQPLGAGPGSTGSASLYGTQPFIIENYYLFVAHEAGWLGLGLFLAIVGIVLRKLWHRREDWLALGVFASGISLSLIALLLPVWADDTVSLVWWGLAAAALASPQSNHSRTGKTKPSGARGSKVVAR